MYGRVRLQTRGKEAFKYTEILDSALHHGIGCNVKNLEISGVLSHPSLPRKQLDTKLGSSSVLWRLQDGQVGRLTRSQGNEVSFCCQAGFTEINKHCDFNKLSFSDRQNSAEKSSDQTQNNNTNNS